MDVTRECGGGFGKRISRVETEVRWVVGISSRQLFATQDSRKTDAQREREQLLLNELVELVNKRDELVRHMHYEEQDPRLSPMKSGFRPEDEKSPGVESREPTG
ncbi:unnamed protein product [Notodromas monacha]|uniref:BMERB domain-containing protein n=1 Tax=Notodromas monacha TaxID=399045 RepID=A0A7R9BHM1_9CRUS|nr:unnamed protein product [Notodromas monacha]CAG0915628.1 unnamed protein product [Notodromas monacha]